MEYMVSCRNLKRFDHQFQGPTIGVTLVSQLLRSQPGTIQIGTHTGCMLTLLPQTIPLREVVRGEDI